MNGRNLNYVEATNLLSASQSVLVRLHPRSCGGGSQHWGRAFLLGASVRNAIVQPFGHKKSEAVPWELVHLWRAANTHRVTRPVECVA